MMWFCFFSGFAVGAFAAVMALVSVSLYVTRKEKHGYGSD